MKKCCNCGAELANDSLFCTECGEPIPQGNVCPHCGASVNDGESFCHNCRKNINELQSEESIINVGENKSRIKKFLSYIISIFVLLMIVGYCSSNKSTNDSSNGSDEVQVTDSGEMVNSDSQTEELIKKRLEDVCEAFYKLDEEKVVEKYFSSEFRKMYNTIGDLEKSGKGGDGLWYSGGFFDGSSEFTYKVSVGNINNIQDNKANVDLVVHSGESASEELGKYVITVPLVFEDGKWYLDDICNRRSDMKEYIEYMENNVKEDSDNYDWLQGHWVYEQGNYKGHLIIHGNTITQFSSMNPEHYNATYRIEGNELKARLVDGLDLNVKIDYANHSIDYGDGNWMHKIE